MTTPYLGLREHGPEYIAYRILKRAKENGRGVVMVFWSPNDSIRIIQPSSFRAYVGSQYELSEDHLIGTYNRDAQLEHIEDDLIAAMQERSRRAA
ncbi:hypothetical protein [Solilutibacter silvestris]|uniref:hypothetical protein n=1 Tax=Solilutibacter silvestris TaxID=1645665 RepID=UPI003D33BB40